ncbi:uncharacterized protein E6C27_scaffold98G00360 [Cucumis melo var. makuwa]|uniref:Uncharacterized protein n=1 Tax=Cucumis melo var. makuwa TaxID=1194695 RepID=A0A5A7USH8_CUCMM|nr:uncharacterized protein E6C27_scaffold98G00360 [Cucumis melo var. makuwa]
MPTSESQCIDIDIDVPYNGCEKRIGDAKRNTLVKDLSREDEQRDEDDWCRRYCQSISSWDKRNKRLSGLDPGDIRMQVLGKKRISVSVRIKRADTRRKQCIRHLEKEHISSLGQLECKERKWKELLKRVAQTTNKSGKQFSIERLKALRATTFKGTTNLADAEKWLNLVEKCFEVMKCPKERKVRLAMFLLRESIKNW